MPDTPPAGRTPVRPGSIWIWEIDEPHACELIKVTEVTWNGEEWMIRAEPLHPSLVNTTYPRRSAGYWNDLRRFREATTLVRDAAGSGGTEDGSRRPGSCNPPGAHMTDDGARPPMPEQTVAFATAAGTGAAPASQTRNTPTPPHTNTGR